MLLISYQQTCLYWTYYEVTSVRYQVIMIIAPNQHVSLVAVNDGWINRAQQRERQVR